MLVKRYIALSHTCCKTEGGLEISVHFCVDKKTKRTRFFYQIHDFKSISSCDIGSCPIYLDQVFLHNL